MTPAGFETGMWTALEWLTVGASVGTIAGYFGTQGWLLELASHFRTQYALMLLVGSAVFAWAQQYGVAALTGGLALANLAQLWPDCRGGAPPRPAGRTSRLLVMNVFLWNRSGQRILELLRRANPDLCLILEPTQALMASLAPVREVYPFASEVVRDDGNGLVLLSRLPLEGVEVLELGRARMPAIMARLRLDGRTLTLIGTHPHSPLTPARAASRNEQLLAVARLAAEQPGAVIVAGDLNITPWSPLFGEVLRIGRLGDSRLGFGLQSTWPAWLPALMRIPIDHCLVSSQVQVHRRWVGGRMGSDHLPLILEVSVGEGSQDLVERGRTRREPWRRR